MIIKKEIKKSKKIPKFLGKSKTLNIKENKLDLENNENKLNLKNNIKNINNNTNISNSNINIITIKNLHIKKMINKNNKSRYKRHIKNGKMIKSKEFNKIGFNDIMGNNNQKMNKFVSLNDYELNTLKYEDALEIDKRSYFQYYYSLLKIKQLILFVFCPAKDYNLTTLKIALFLTNFSLYFTINCFFFNDETMHMIYVNNGRFHIFYQLPQILYTTIITIFTDRILRQLSLSENNFIELKQANKYATMISKSKTIKACLTIKFSIFFILNFLLLFFCWYFISCFCAVFYNTQIILITDSFFSFGTTLIYPFFIYLLPGIFRIPSLKAAKKDKRCLYLTGKMFALI